MSPKIIYKQKIRDSWMQQKEFKDWVAKDASDETKAFCTYCKCSINAKVFDLRAHAKTKKHISRANCFVQSNKLNFVPTLTKSAEQEAALCLFVAEHTSIGTIDHLTKLCIQNFYKSNSAEVIKMQRTKCANIIRNVLSPHFKEDLRNDIGKSKFSILLDESTDISVTKLLGIVINYFSMERGKITSTFLGLVQLDSGDAVGIVNALLEELNNWKLDPKNLIGIGTDNASVMTGRNRGVYAELKKRIPSLILIRCVCHSVQLAVNYSCGKFLPDTLEFLIYETYNWFSKSSNRQLAYKNIYQLINNDKDPLKIPRVSDTRWLSIEGTVSRVLEQWIELKLLFKLASHNEKCHKAKILSDLYNDEHIHLYLLFLKPILKEMQRINKSFQSNNANSTKLLQDLILAINSLRSKIIPTDLDIDIIQYDFENFVQRDLYLGYDFENKVKELKLEESVEKRIRDECINFIIELVKQLKQRLPDNFKVLEKVEMFSVDKILCTKKESIVELLEHFGLPNIDEIKCQYDNINFVKWINNDDTVAFWSEVIKYKDSSGHNPFILLAEFAISILSLPWSNAEVERVFSQVNIVKTKLRNRMNIDTLNSILFIRYGLRRHEKCCYSYTVPEIYLKKIGTNESYNNTPNEDFVDLDSIVLLV